MTSSQHSLSPTAPNQRLGSLDLLRGFALCGILVINMRYFAMPMAGRALGNPNLPGGDFASADFWSWFGSSLLFEDKMMALFSTLFGAGIWLMKDRGVFLHYRRMFWLLAIGLFHAVLLWFGDILTLYALCGMVVVWFRRLPPSLLVVLGLSSVFLALGEAPLTQMLAESTPVEQVAEAPDEGATKAAVEPAETTEAVSTAEAGTEEPVVGIAPDDSVSNPAEEPGGTEPPPSVAETAPQEAAPQEAAPEAPAATGLLAWREELQQGHRKAFREHFESETEAEMHHGSWWGQVRWRSTLVLWWQGAGFLLNGLFWNGGLMLVGMGLMGLGFLSGKLRASTYLSVGFAAMAFGLAFFALGLWPHALEPLGRRAALWQPGDGPPPESFLRYLMLAGAVRNFGTLLVCFGWASLLLWLNRSGALRLLLYPLRAVGRMALTNYLTHTVVCLLIFEGWAYGRWYEVRYFDQMKLVGIILAVQLVACPLWLAVFRFGPAEWLWRSLTYWRLQPMRRGNRRFGPPAVPQPPTQGPPPGFAAESPLAQTPG
ncbi:MAG: DUF418 domain-containing protein [Planctomycetes bacterium]|nr:DUF418 domain-containing protein [Planctomycetota bacterium]